MTSTIMPAVDRLQVEMRKALATIDQQRQTEIRTILEAMKEADRDRADALADARKKRQEAETLVAQSLAEEERIEAHWRNAVENICRGLSSLIHQTDQPGDNQK